MRIFYLTTILVMFAHTWLNFENRNTNSSAIYNSTNETTVARTGGEWDDFTSCGFANAQSNSTTAVCVLCSIQDAANTTDSDTLNYSVLSIPLAAGSGSVQQQMIFPSVYAPGTNVKIMLEFPAQVVDATLLSALEISSFNGATSNNDAYLGNSSQLQITPVAGSTRLSVLFTAGAAFDRVQVKLRAGIVSALVKLNLYYARIYHEPPVISNTALEVCALTPVTLSATDAPGHFIEWTQEQAGGGSTIIGTGASINATGFTGSRTYYAQYVRSYDNCHTSPKTPVTITTIAAPQISLGPQSIQRQVNAAASFTIDVFNDDQLTYRWQSDAGSGFTDLTEGGSYENTATATLNIPAVAFSMNGYEYRCIISRCGQSDTSQAATLTITKLSQTISFVDQTNGSTVNVVYGDAAISGVANTTSSLAVAYQSSNTNVLSVNTTGSVSIKGAGTAVITASQAGDASYAPAQDISFTVQVGRKLLGITANTASKVYGTNDPPLTYSVSGLVNGDLESIITGGLKRDVGEDVSTYAIVQNTINAGNNYTIDYTGANFTITKASQVITWVQELEAGCNGINQITLTANSSSNLSVSYSVADNSIATVTGSTLTAAGPGSTSVTAGQAGDNNYLPATPVSIVFNNLRSSMIRQHWNDVLLFDNSGGEFVSWKWFKNNTEVSGQTQPYYSEKQSLHGTYYAIATDRAGNTLRTCPITISAGTAPVRNMRVYPNPAKAGNPVTVEINYPAGELQGARLVISHTNGTVVQEYNNVQPVMTIALPSSGQLFIVSIVLANGQRATVNVLAK
ncbi:MBG domain-containing protein [Pseudobacter ginsenosidimutans]|uniref:Ig-like domain-containing protein n=1 Tax=Pseudobacter ginsenosidimutans TaxID=661488 RepID=A0A4Q7MWY0_9BACT|nr:MBG domain-containing protein [Pseudobacter ginsenosidimutans]QEC40708.1 immunoglobulin domain-containing protein [Pseudobacter ginsenosidimutans]RZS72574.1 hypothetical protein EV199_4495 [Pseudobacter ginsenosidimutans]